MFASVDATQSVPAQAGALTALEVTLASTDDALQLGVDEAYTLRVPAPAAGSANATLACATAYGCLRGFETFVQLVVRRAVAAAPLVVDDAPRFAHRGVLVDTARHFLPLATLRAVVEGMAADKLNTLHLHLTDAQAFPFASVAEPALARGAWAPDLVYSRADLAGLVTFAKARGVRVVPEVDSPAHVQSWSVGRPDLVLDCGYGSVLDPTQEATYEVLAALLTELASIFPDDAVHVGVDEVDVSAASCYNNSRIAAWMPTQGIAAGDWKGVVRYHLARVQSIVHSLGKRMSAWQEAADHYGLEATNPTNAPPGLDRDTALHVRCRRALTRAHAQLARAHTYAHSSRPRQRFLPQVWLEARWEWWNMSYLVQSGFRGVKSDDWYLSNPAVAWDDAYAADPLTNAVCSYAAGWPNCTCTQQPDPDQYGCFNITEPELVARVIGGEASVWGEAADETNVLQLLWPRASAVAERLWSPQSVNDAAAALPRLIDQRCRLVARGVPAPPLAPGFCDTALV